MPKTARAVSVGIPHHITQRAIIARRFFSRTKTGRPCGDDSFVKKIEEAVGRRLVAMPRGRPRKGE